MIDSLDSLVPEVDDQGNIIGSMTRREAHSGSKRLHPVVHLHVFNNQGDLYLQKRPDWKDIQPGKWDTSVGGHVDLGESVAQALQREVHEELGITDYEAQRLTHYVFESDKEKELVFVHRTVYDLPIAPDKTELADGRFWSQDEILANIGKGIFTPNFENEYRQIIMPSLQQTDEDEPTAIPLG